VPPAVIEPLPADLAAGFDDSEVDTVRACLDRLDEHDRRTLWQCLDLLDRVCASGDLARIHSAIALAPHSIQPTLAAIAAGRVRRAGQRIAGRLPEPDARFHYERPEYRHLSGRATNADTWTASWVWSSFSRDALARVAVHRAGGYAHDSVPLLYRHAGQPLGFTTAWWLGDHGDLDVEAWLLPSARAQAAARYVRQGALGMSIGTRSRHASWVHLSPREWEPRTGDLDLERREEVEVAEVSLTPTPAQPACMAWSVW
jgi:hypothetical protein